MVLENPRSEILGTFAVDLGSSTRIVTECSVSSMVLTSCGQAIPSRLPLRRLDPIARGDGWRRANKRWIRTDRPLLSQLRQWSLGRTDFQPKGASNKTVNPAQTFAGIFALSTFSASRGRPGICELILQAFQLHREGTTLTGRNIRRAFQHSLNGHPVAPGTFTNVFRIVRFATCERKHKLANHSELIVL